MAKWHPVWPSFWRGDRIRWSDQQKLLALYLLTCEHRNLEGFYYLPKPYVASDLEWELAVVTDVLGAVQQAGFCAYDETARVVLVPKALAHQAPKSAKQIAGAIASIEKVPASALWDAFLEACDRHAPRLADAIRNGSTPGPHTHSDGSGDGPDTHSDGSSYAGARSSTSSTISTPEAAAAREHTREALSIEQALGALAARHDVPAPSAGDIDVVLADHPDRDHRKALDEVKRWAARECPRNLTGAFRRAMTEAPALPVGARPAAVTAAQPDDEEQWAAAVQRLRAHLSESNFGVWIEPLVLAGVSDGALVLSAAEEVAAWVRDRFAAAITGALDGRPVRIVSAATGVAA